MDKSVAIALACSALVILTTIHAQDFADVEGDAQSGRRTVPIVAPEASRWSMPILLVGWSIYLCTLWGPHPLAGAIFCAWGAWVGYRYMSMRSVADDKQSYIYYNVRPSRRSSRQHS